MPTEVPIACSLDCADLTDRTAWMATLGRDLYAVEAAGARARLSFRAERRSELEDFVRAESSCCAFFRFELTGDDDGVQLLVAAPEEAEWAVRGLVAGFVAGWERLA